MLVNDFWLIIYDWQYHISFVIFSLWFGIHFSIEIWLEFSMDGFINGDWRLQLKQKTTFIDLLIFVDLANHFLFTISDSHLRFFWNWNKKVLDFCDFAHEIKIWFQQINKTTTTTTTTNLLHFIIVDLVNWADECVDNHLRWGVHHRDICNHHSVIILVLSNFIIVIFEFIIFNHLSKVIL